MTTTIQIENVTKQHRLGGVNKRAKRKRRRSVADTKPVRRPTAMPTYVREQPMPTTETAYDEIVNLFARGTTPHEIVQFHPSQQAQARVRYLLDRLKSEQITDDESAELERLGQLEQMMQLIKARARSIQNS